MTLEIPALSADDQEKADARRRISRAAHDGQRPSTGYHAEDLAWAFGDNPADLARLEQIAVDVLADRQKRHRLERERLDLRTMTDAVLKEWAEKERVDRRLKAEAEARKRLAARQQS